MKLVALCVLLAAAPATEYAAAQTASTGSEPALSSSKRQAYPGKPIRLIVAQSAGGNADIVARAVGQKLGAALGQQLVIDNRGGGGGIIAAEMVVKAPPDGYTLLLVSSAFGVMPSLHKKLPYDPLKDLAPITLVVSAPNILLVHPAQPVKSVRELIAYANANPGKINFGSSGNGGSTHLAGELFKMMAGVEIVHVPYKGAAAALVDLIAGNVQMMFASLPSAIAHVRAGRLRALAVTGAKRSAALPELPTVAETGLPDFETSAWQGIFAPAATPRAIITRLNREVARAVSLPDLKDRLTTEGAEPVANTPEEFAAYLKRELAKWAKVVKAAGIRAD